MKAAKLIGKRKHKIIDVDIPIINEFEVLVEVHICGLCASELHNWQEGILNDFTYMGHEVVGVVKEIGKYVKNVNVGDRVTGYIVNGFAEYSKVHYSLVTKVPKELEDIESIGEPLGCLVSGARQTNVDFGDKVAIIGLGYMGLGFMQIMNRKGASKVTAIDIREKSLEIAKKLGATDTYFPDNINDNMKVTTYGINMDGGYDVVVEASGTQPALTLAGEMTGVHKTMSIVGFHQNGNRNVDMCLYNWKAINIINAHERRDDFMMDSINRGLDMIKHGKINMKSLITHSYDFADIDKGFSDFENKIDGYIKGYVKIK